MKRKTKKEMVIDIYDREAMGEVTAREIAQINQGLVAEFGEGGAMTPAEIVLLVSLLQAALTEGKDLYDAAQLKAMADLLLRPAWASLPAL